MRQKNGWFLNPDRTSATRFLKCLLDNQKRYGYRACPCRPASGSKEEDQDIICPCLCRGRTFWSKADATAQLRFHSPIAQTISSILPVFLREEQDRVRGACSSSMFPRNQDIFAWKYGPQRSREDQALHRSCSPVQGDPCPDLRTRPHRNEFPGSRLVLRRTGRTSPCTVGESVRPAIRDRPAAGAPWAERCFQRFRVERKIV